MFKKWFGKNDEATADTVNAPEVMGLRLGGAFELDSLRLRLIESKLIVEGVAATQFIQAVGEVQLDENTKVLRFYTDDEGFLEILLSGGSGEEHVSDVKLWYFYDTKSIDSDSLWENVLKEQIARPSQTLEGFDFKQAWKSVGESSAAVAVTEKTYYPDREPAETDQFLMLYERHDSDDLYEYLLVSGEEKIINYQADRCLVRSTGFDIMAADISIIG